MADGVDSSAYACDIDSSLERLMSLACDESPYLAYKDFRRKGLPCGVHPEMYMLRSCDSLASQVTWQDGHDLKPWALGRTVSEFLTLGETLKT